jgi:hypothetical protein
MYGKCYKCGMQLGGDGSCSGCKQIPKECKCTRQEVPE